MQIRVNEACRRLRKPLYAGGTYGLLGYIFCDLLEHEYIAPYVFDMVAVRRHFITDSGWLLGIAQGGSKTERRTSK
jgi:molybdopterin/thiamine biosynthesis adenylyltransferase